MSTVHDIRKSMESQLDWLEARAVALENAVTKSRHQMQTTVEASKQQASRALTAFEEQLKEYKGAGEEAKSRVQARIEHLRIQLALGQADAKGAIDAQRKQIADSVAAFEASVDKELGSMNEAMEKAAKEWVGKANAYKAKMDTLADGWSKAWDEGVTQLDANRKQIEQQLKDYREKMATYRDHAQVRLSDFHREMSAGFDQIRKAFTSLWS